MPRILHLGVGNFHRAHQAWYTARAGDDWRITGVAMTNAALVEAMRDGGYVLGVRGPDGLTTERIEIHDRMILARDDPQAVIDAFIDPDLHVVSLTITEKGYRLATRTGALDMDHPAVRADLDGRPTGAIGLLTHGLAARARAGLPSLTVMSCDNLSGNGDRTRRAVRDFAVAAGLTLDSGTRCPNTMVDRITPATTPELIAEIETVAGVPARAPVATEAFSEWIVEDAFAGPRPAWETAGAEIVADVAPYEMRKLHLLNAAHSYLAYAGLLAGHAHVHEAIGDPALRPWVDRLWDEVGADLPKQIQATLPAYRRALIDRFTVSAMRHALAQVAMDGSLKLRERIVPTIRIGVPQEATREVLAVWIAFVLRARDRSETLSDANADRIHDVLESARDVRAACDGLLRIVGLSDPSGDLIRDLAGRIAARRA